MESGLSCLRFRSAHRRRVQQPTGSLASNWADRCPQCCCHSPRSHCLRARETKLSFMYISECGICGLSEPQKRQFREAIKANICIQSPLRLAPPPERRQTLEWRLSGGMAPNPLIGAYASEWRLNYRIAFERRLNYRLGATGNWCIGPMHRTS
jgi:hypothetical protein